jgi:hypothetical protein
MASCTEDMPRSAWSVALETYHGASTVIRRILDWLLWSIDVLLQINIAVLREAVSSS